VAAVFPTLLAQLMSIRGVGIIGPGQAGTFMNLVPVFAAAFVVATSAKTFASTTALP